jgi:hypothetical protein
MTDNLKITKALEKAVKLLGQHLSSLTIIGTARHSGKLVTATAGELEDLLASMARDGEDTATLRRVSAGKTAIYFT